MLGTGLKNDTQDLPGCEINKMSWSGLIECARDGIRALRTLSEYARSPAYREKVDALAECTTELNERLERLKCLPAIGEPSFTLLARDPQAADRVQDWINQREKTHRSPHDEAKLVEARRIVEKMREWRSLNPQDGMGVSRPVGDGPATHAQP